MANNQIILNVLYLHKSYSYVNILNNITKYFEMSLYTYIYIILYRLHIVAMNYFYLIIRTTNI